MLDVAIIIVNYNSSDEVIELVFNLRKKVKLKNYKIIVVDNNSDYKRLKKIKGIKLIKSRKNLGFAGGNNLGIKSIKAKYYCLINPDVRLNNDAISILKATLDKKAEYCIAGPAIIKHNKEKIEYYKFGDALYEISRLFKLQWLYNYNFKMKLNKNIVEVDWVTGAFFMIKGSVIDKIGLMDESYFLYSEESDYCVRTKKNGFKIIYVRDAKIMHTEGFSTNKNNGFRLYYQYTSKLKFIKRYFGFSQYIILKIFYFFDILIKFFIRGFLEIIKIDKQNYSLYYWKLLKKFILDEV